MLTTPTAMATEIISHSGMNTCNSGWYYISGTFLNYCPDCGSTETLIWNPKGTIEGEWTCSACGSDYCVCGREKTNGKGKHLINAIHRPKVKSKEPPQKLKKLKTQPNPIEIVKHNINKHYLGIYL
jgi:hypothetical protein